MDVLGLVIYLLTGATAGYLLHVFLRDASGPTANIIVGSIGALVSILVFQQWMGLYPGGRFAAEIINALLGAGLLLLVFRIGTQSRRNDRPKRPNVSAPETRGATVGSPEPVRSTADLRNSVFLSYRRADSIDVTGRLYDKLVSELGEGTVFKDIDSIPLGSDFRDHIDESLRNCQVFLLVVGRNWKSGVGTGAATRIDDPDDYVRLEVASALRRKIPVIPVLIHGAEIPSISDLPEEMSGIAYRQAIRLRSDPDFHRDAERIVGFLRSHLRQS
jgi:uncharacterized membrane protein YeaQ/YmgE (transglycosylase-associated protein family)